MAPRNPRTQLGAIAVGAAMVATLAGCVESGDPVKDTHTGITPTTAGQLPGSGTPSAESTDEVVAEGVGQEFALPDGLNDELQVFPAPPGSKAKVGMMMDSLLELSIEGDSADHRLWYTNWLRSQGLQVIGVGDTVTGTGRGLTVLVSTREGVTKVDITKGMSGTPTVSLPDMGDLPTEWPTDLPSIDISIPEGVTLPDGITLPDNITLGG